MARRFRRYKRRYSRKLSTRRIFSNRSARAQASQIYALRRKINRVAYANKPEIKTKLSDSKVNQFTSQTLNSVWDYMSMPVIGVGGSPNDRIGNKISMKSCTFFLSGEYFNNSETGYHDSESSGAQVRLVIVQMKDATAPTSVPQLSDIVEGAANTGPSYTLLAVRPLANNITQRYKVLADRRWTVTNEKNQFMRKITVRPGTIRYDTDNKSNYVRAFLIVSGLHYDQDFTEHVHIAWQCKTAYTDA